MELKLSEGVANIITLLSLNRTFYGIETLKRERTMELVYVLIVPFMELKLIVRTFCDLTILVLIVPFMELKQHFEITNDTPSTVLIVPFMELKPLPRLVV